MTQYVFKAIDEGTPEFSFNRGRREAELVFEADTLTHVLEEFTCFLRGAGFFFKGEVDIVNGESDFQTPGTPGDEMEYPLYDPGFSSKPVVEGSFDQGGGGNSHY